ncbi:MAG: hypothetical protein LBE09_01000 [Christensenellaceae bacterium]|nr:hypothetical protein [Christensenellaceae bacterium]
MTGQGLNANIYHENISTPPAMTVLTHGLGGSAAAWINNLGHFECEQSPLIERLRDNNPNATVYCAKMMGSKDFMLIEQKANAYCSNYDLDEIDKSLIRTALTV